MIQYALKCAAGHRFDSWFQSASAFDKLFASGLVTCAVCGDDRVEKTVMAPRVNNASGAERAPTPETDTPPPGTGPLSAPQSPAEQALAALRKHVETNSEYVGRDFVKEALAIHEGAAPDRAIYGEAKLEEARKLAQDGVPVAPLPFMPGRKAN